MLKYSLAAILLAVASGALWIEQGHHIVIEAPAAVALSAAAAACPDNDTAPYSARCLDYLNLPVKPVRGTQVTAVKGPQRVEPAPCPETDNVPYSASCIAFLKGATEAGMRWRATAEPWPQ